MPKIRTLLYIFVVIFLQAKIKAEIEPTEIPINSYISSIKLNSENSYSRYFVINYKEEDLINTNYLIISTNNTIYDQNAFIYISFNEKNPSAENRNYFSQTLGKNEIIINISKLKGNSKLYINIHSIKETTVDFNGFLLENIEITYINKKRFKLSDTTKVIFSPDDFLKNKKIMFYSIGENINYFSMKIKSNSIEYFPQQKFYNGYGIIIDLKKIQETKYEIILTPNEKYPGIDPLEKEVEVGIELAEEGINNARPIEIMEHIYGYISTSENCYQIENTNFEYNNITILVNAYSQSLNFILYTEPIYSLDIFDNYYIKLPSEYFKDKKFCFKKFTPKEKEEEELGEISYDFQIYYDQDLTNIQSFLHPLVNGKIYTYSLKPNEIMIYRHTSFNKYNFLYTSTMNVLRGTPVLYGYECETYPECNLDKDKFEQMKIKGKIDIIHKINRYYINKKLYALGDKETNGENMSQSRKQYLSVVVCESTEDFPNKGECQYTIEIDNYNDEIQLIPELVHANTVLFDKNYFRIKLDDYLNTKYLKIYFTIISGNANINIYSDKNYENKIKKYNYRYVHRKEIIEITEDFIPNYYIEITNENTAFIEIKYETDFHYKGYLKLNPNEMNIEYVNKEKGYVPYEVCNPDYFYPINNTKNNDFYFRINTLDCSMTYKFNFEEEKNITSKYYEVKKDDIAFGTSYGFELKLENYFHTVKDNTEDCAMIIYTGEKNKDIPLLIIEDMFHPSDFSDTYYIYPFSINDNFKGVLVQIKFETESIIKLNREPKVLITFKISNQNSDFEQYNITSDSSFFISETKIKNYCPYKFYQCSLIIEINKENPEDNFTILTNIHSSFYSVEYILKNKVYNYNLRPNEKKFFYTQIDQNEQGEINFMFNQGNAKVYAKLVQKDILEEDANWNRRILLPEYDSKDLLYYDPLNKVINYNSKEKNNCVKGCELYILIQSEENTKKETALTEVSFNIDKKISISENSVVEISLNKYISGILENNKYKYYTITIPYDYYKISINLYSSFGRAYIKLGKGHICKNDSSLWEINSNDDYGRIIIEANDKNIGKDTLNGISFSIGITNKENVDLYDNILYFLEIQGLYNNPKSYYQLKNERSIICDTEENLFCHAILYINKNYNNNKNLLYASSNIGNIKIFAKYYSEIQESSFQNSIENLFPIENNFDQKTEVKNYIFLNSEKIIDGNKNLYILLTIYSETKNDKIRLISSGIDTSKTLLSYGSERLFYFVRDIKFSLPYDNLNNNYILNIRTIKGTQKFLFKNDETIPDLNGNYQIEITSNPSGKSFEIDNINKNEKEQGIMLSYSKMKDDKLFKLEKNIKNEIYLLLSGDKSFPQYVYIKLDSNSSIKIEMLFHDITYEQNYPNSDDIFKINGYIINHEMLNKRINNPEIEIKGEIIQGNYLRYEKTGIIEIMKDKIKTDDEYYLYIKIEKDNENKNVYSSIKVQYSVNEKEEGMEIYENKFYYSEINNINKEDYYIINKQSDLDKYIIVDIAEKIPVLNNLEIRKELFKNNINSKILNDDLIQEIDYNGRKRIIANVVNNDGIKLYIKKKNEDENNKYYSINYNLIDNISNFENFTNFMDTLSISKNKQNNKKTNLIFNNILRYKRFFTVRSGSYYIDIFEIKDEIKEKSNIFSTYLGNHEEKNIIFSTVLNNINFFMQNLTIEIEMTKNELKNYYIRVLADIFNNDGTREKFIYNMTLVDIDKREETNEDDNNKNKVVSLIIFISIPLILLIVVVVVLIIVKRKKNEYNVKKPEDIESDSLLP